MNKDIIDKLEEIRHYNYNIDQFKTAVEAIEVINNLRNALHRIGFDYVELSYDKVQWQYHDHMKIAKKAYQDSFPPEEKTEPKPLDDNF